MPTYQPYGGYGWLLACLLPPSAISLFATVLLKLEGSQRGVRWSTISLDMTSQYPFSASTVFQMLAFDIALYTLLTWYFDKVCKYLASLATDADREPTSLRPSAVPSKFDDLRMGQNWWA